MENISKNLSVPFVCISLICINAENKIRFFTLSLITEISSRRLKLTERFWLVERLVESQVIYLI